MILIWKNKGLLVLPYTIFSLAFTALIVGALHRNIGGVFSKIDLYTTMGIGLLLSAVWTYLTKDDYYRSRDGTMKKMETENEFFFINMGTWAIILFVGALVLFGNLLFHYFEPTT
jgi:hypothetical protein